MASESNVSTSLTVPEFSLMTFNVWFDQHAQNERGQQLFQLTLSSSAYFMVEVSIVKDLQTGGITYRGEVLNN